MLAIKMIPICGDLSPVSKHGLRVSCTELPGHDGNHRTIFSIQAQDKVGCEYTWV